MNKKSSEYSVRISLLSNIAKVSLEKWQDDEAYITDPCAFCVVAATIHGHSLNMCKNCICPHKLCAPIGQRSLGQRSLFEKIIIDTRKTWNIIYDIKMKSINQKLRQKMIRKLQKLVKW
jgi:hypothetical protein